MNQLQVDLSAEPCPKDTLIKIEGMGEFAVSSHKNLLHGLLAAYWLIADISIQKQFIESFISRITVLEYDPDKKILEVRIS